tara:strand:+ start:56 stop:316 length:261 start_codon:yes stop_codon:yes gene_type:complete
MSILHKVKEAIRHHYAFPGGYPLFAVTADDGALCCTCLSVEFKNICYSINEEINDGFRVADVVINYESEILCDNCGNDIEKAYEND